MGKIKMTGTCKGGNHCGMNNNNNNSFKNMPDNYPRLVLVPHPSQPTPPPTVIQRNFTLYTQLTTNPPGVIPDPNIKLPNEVRQQVRQLWTKVPNPSPPRRKYDIVSSSSSITSRMANTSKRMLFNTVDLSAFGMSNHHLITPPTSPTIVGFPHHQQQQSPVSSTTTMNNCENTHPDNSAPMLRRRFLRVRPMRTVEEVRQSLAANGTANNPWRTWMTVKTGIPLGMRTQQRRMQRAEQRRGEGVAENNEVSSSRTLTASFPSNNVYTQTSSVPSGDDTQGDKENGSPEKKKDKKPITKQENSEDQKENNLKKKKETISVPSAEKPVGDREKSLKKESISKGEKLKNNSMISSGKQVEGNKKKKLKKKSKIPNGDKAEEDKKKKSKKKPIISSGEKNEGDKKKKSKKKSTIPSRDKAEEDKKKKSKKKSMISNGEKAVGAAKKKSKKFKLQNKKTKAKMSKKKKSQSKKLKNNKFMSKLKNKMLKIRKSKIVKSKSKIMKSKSQKYIKSHRTGQQRIGHGEAIRSEIERRVALELELKEEIECYKKLIKAVIASNRKLARMNEMIGMSLLIDRHRPFNFGLREMTSSEFASVVLPLLTLFDKK